MQYFGTLLLSLFVTLALVPIFRKLALHYQAVDIPNERKVHAQPMARTGGLAMAVGALIPLVFWAPHEPLVQPLFVSCALIVGFGFFDDLRDLHPRSKIVVQLAAALIVVVFADVRIYSFGSLAPEGFILPDVLSIPLTIFVIVGVTNAINLSDGLDGLAGGISLLSFVCLAFLAYFAGKIGLTLISVAMCGAIFGFLRFNTHPATVFMGDAGSQLLGFLGVVLALYLTQRTLYSPLVALLLLGFPILDTLRVMLERKSHGLPLFSPDKNHFHHKLLKIGFRHSESVLIIYILQTGLTVAAFLLRFFSDWLLLWGYLLFSFFVLSALHLSEKYHWSLDRQGFWAKGVMGTLRPLKSHEMLIRVSFPGLQICATVILVLIVFAPVEIPLWLGLLSFGLAALLALTHLLIQKWLGMALRLGTFLVVPFLLYLTDMEKSFGPEKTAWSVMTVLFGVLVMLMFLVIRYTRRKGYKGTPLDYLILLIALTVPNMPIADSVSSGLMIGIAAQTVALFFAVEVWLVEMRGKFGRLEWLVLAMLLVTGGRAFLQ